MNAARVFLTSLSLLTASAAHAAPPTLTGTSLCISPLITVNTPGLTPTRLSDSLYSELKRALQKGVIPFKENNVCSRSSAEVELTAEYTAGVNPEVRVAISVVDRSSGQRIYRWSKVTYQPAAGGAAQATAAARTGVALMLTELVRAYRAANPPRP